MQNFVNKFRPNVLLVALMLSILVVVLLGYLFSWLEEVAPNVQWDAAVMGAVFASALLIVGAVLGGLVSVMSQVAQDPPPPVVPAETAEALIGALVGSLCAHKDGGNPLSPPYQGEDRYAAPAHRAGPLQGGDQEEQRE